MNKNETNNIINNVLKQLIVLGNEYVIQSNIRLGITSSNTVGIKIPQLRYLAKSLGKNHPLALELWKTEIREAQIIATLIAQPRIMTLKSMQYWANSCDSWDVVDAACYNLFRKSKYADDFIRIIFKAKNEMAKRFGFVLMALLAKYNKKISNDTFKKYLEMIAQEAADERRYVCKAINWALREIGKKNHFLNLLSINICNQLRKCEDENARRVGKHALRGLVTINFDYKD